MPTIRLVPSSYNTSHSSYASVNNATNMYYNTDHTANYATLQGRNRNSTTAYYIFINGFNFGDVPDGIQVSSIEVKIRCYRNSNQRTGANYRLRLCSAAAWANAISGTTLSSDIGTTQTVYTIPIGNLDLDTMKSYGAGFSIAVPLSSTSSSRPYVYVYGAEIAITYTLPTPYDITSNLNGQGTLDPSGTTQVYSGDDYTLYIEPQNAGDTVTATDNGVDVTGSLVQIQSGNEELIPDDYTSSGFTVTDITNAYTNISDGNRCTCDLAGGTTGDLYLNIQDLNLPSSATIQSLSCEVSLQISRNGSSSSMSATCQMYSGNTPKGSATTITTTAQDVARNTYTLNIGTWTVSELPDARVNFHMVNSASSTHRYYYVYGVSFNIAYEINGTLYSYTITNVQGNHTINVDIASGASSKWWYKVNGTWREVRNIYYKNNGSWVGVTKMYTKNNGNWES